MEKAPPALIRILVTMDDMDNAVNNVIAVANVMMPIAPTTPALPTTHGPRRYIMTPRMVSRVGVKTP